MPDASDLASRQAALISALVAGAPLPDGFDRDHARHVAGVLRLKRRKAMVHAAPEVPGVIGAEWRDLFEQFADDLPVTRRMTPLDDAIAFCAWVARIRGRRWRHLRLVIRLRWRRMASRVIAGRVATGAEGTPSTSRADEA